MTKWVILQIGSFHIRLQYEAFIQLQKDMVAQLLASPHLFNQITLASNPLWTIGYIPPETMTEYEQLNGATLIAIRDDDNNTSDVLYYKTSVALNMWGEMLTTVCASPFDTIRFDMPIGMTTGYYLPERVQ